MEWRDTNVRKLPANFVTVFSTSDRTRPCNVFQSQLMTKSVFFSADVSAE